MKTMDAIAILGRLGEKGILNKSTIKEINKDISYFLKERVEVPGSGNKILKIEDTP